MVEREEQIVVTLHKEKKRRKREEGKKRVRDRESLLYSIYILYFYISYYYINVLRLCIYTTIYDLHLLAVSHIMPMLRSVYRASFKIISSNLCANALKRKYQLKHTHTHSRLLPECIQNNK